MAKKIVFGVAEKEREEALKGIDKSKQVTIMSKPFPRFDKRVGDVAKLLVESVDSQKVVDEEAILETAKEKKEEKGVGKKLEFAKKKKKEDKKTNKKK